MSEQFNSSFFLFFFPLWPRLTCNFAYNAPLIDHSCLINLICSCACKAFKGLAKVMVDKSFEFSKAEIVISNLSRTVTSSFYTILESANSPPNNLTLFAIPRSLSEYSWTISNSFIFYNLNSLIRFSICIPLIFSSPSYSFLRKSQISLTVFKVIILVNIVGEIIENK